MIDLHYWPTPNGWKITIMLEEAGLPYRMIPVNIGRGEQFKPEFLAISPNNRMPAIVDHQPKGGGAPISTLPTYQAATGSIRRCARGVFSPSRSLSGSVVPSRASPA